MSITYSESKNIEGQDLLSLYLDAGWSAYTEKPDVLFDAIENSLYVLTAWNDKQLVGLIRVVGDGTTIAYIQDILVLKPFRRKKIGTQLMNKVLEKFHNVRQKVLLTDDTPETRRFYESSGFQACNDEKIVAFIQFRTSQSETG